MSQNTNRSVVRLMCAALTTTICTLVLVMHVRAESLESIAANAYLPVIINVGTNESTGPLLISPDDSAVLETLIPTFTWDNGQQPPSESATIGICLAFGTRQDELDGCASSGLWRSGVVQRVAWFNLEPDTVYFWRVGFIFDWNYDDIHWSETRRFTTGPVGGVILPPPTLNSPADGSAVPQDEIVLIWSEVVGAVRYNVSIRNTDTGRGYGWGEYEGTRLNLSSMAFWVIKPGDNYEWSVVVRNDYAWSDESASWSFSVLPPTNGRQPSTPSSSLTLQRMKAGTTWIYSQD